MVPDTLPHDLGVSALRQKRDDLRKELDGLENDLDRTRTEVSSLGERLRFLTRERAVAKREIQAQQNELYVLKRKRAIIEEKLQRHAPAYQEGQAALHKLQVRQRSQTERIEELDAEIARLTVQIIALEAELHGGDQRLTEIEDAKRTMVEDISRRLKSASLDRGKIEDALNDVAFKFRDTVSARDETLLAHAEVKESLESLRAEIKHLEQRIADHERMKVLRTERAAARRAAEDRTVELATVQEDLEAVRGAVLSKRIVLDELTRGAGEVARHFESLDQELGAYARAKAEEKAAGDELEASRVAVAEFEARLARLFLDEPVLEANLFLMAKTVEAVAGLGLARE